MKLILNTAHVYMIIGVISGLYYREITKLHDFTGQSQLGVLHTHLLALGMLFFLVVLALEKQFALTEHALFDWFYWVYNIGLAVTTGMMALHGTLTVLGRSAGMTVAILAGLGHIVLTVGLVLFFITVGKRLGSMAPSGSQAGLDPEERQEARSVPS